MEHKKLLIEWCNQNKILIKPTDYMFFIDDTITLKPSFILNYRTYVDFIDSPERMTDKLREAYKAFQASYGNIIVLPIDIMPELNKINREDLSEKFDINI